MPEVPSFTIFVFNRSDIFRSVLTTPTKNRHELSGQPNIYRVVSREEWGWLSRRAMRSVGRIFDNKSVVDWADARMIDYF